MSLRSAVRSALVCAAGAAVVITVAAMVSPTVRRTVLGLVGRGVDEEPEQPTHIVLPDRLSASEWDGLDEAIEDGRSAGSAVAGDIALAGA